MFDRARIISRRQENIVAYEKVYAQHEGKGLFDTAIRTILRGFIRFNMVRINANLEKLVGSEEIDGFLSSVEALSTRTPEGSTQQEWLKNVQEVRTKLEELKGLRSSLGAQQVAAKVFADQKPPKLAVIARLDEAIDGGNRLLRGVKEHASWGSPREEETWESLEKHVQDLITLRALGTDRALADGNEMALCGAFYMLFEKAAKAGEAEVEVVIGRIQQVRKLRADIEGVKGLDKLRDDIDRGLQSIGRAYEERFDRLSQEVEGAESTLAAEKEAIEQATPNFNEMLSAPVLQSMIFSGSTYPNLQQIEQGQITGGALEGAQQQLPKLRRVIESDPAYQAAADYEAKKLLAGASKEMLVERSDAFRRHMEEAVDDGIAAEQFVVDQLAHVRGAGKPSAASVSYYHELVRKGNQQEFERAIAGLRSQQPYELSVEDRALAALLTGISRYHNQLLSRDVAFLRLGRESRAKELYQAVEGLTRAEGALAGATSVVERREALRAGERALKSLRSELQQAEDQRDRIFEALS